MRFKSVLAAACFLLLPLAACAADATYVEGTDFKTINPPLPAENASGKVQVMELFWYGCPHCNEMEPSIKAWLKNKPADVEFVRVPAVFSRVDRDGRSPNAWFTHAKAFYAAQALGVGEKMHERLFHALHKEDRPLRTEEDLAKFFAEQGVPADDFKAAFSSFAVETKVARAMDLTKRSGITGVPAILVNGKYQVLGKRATSYDDYLRITDYLIAQERGTR
jgi:thiol:disulfide interchange protein DsbA